MTRSSLQALLFLVVCLILAGCGGSVPDADEAAQEGILLIGNATEPRSLDPQLINDARSHYILTSLTENLIAYHPTDDNLPEPGVAESWEPNTDASVWTFQLRRNARWSNGDAVTAHDFVASYRRMLDPDFPAPYANMLFQLKNAESFKQGELQDFSQVGVQAVDDHTLRLELVGPTPYFLNMLKHQSWGPVHLPTIEAHGDPLDPNSEWTQPGNFVGNGPFLLEEWLPNQYVRVVRNPYYWDLDQVRLNAVYFFPITDVSTEKLMFDSGQLHITSGVPSNSVQHLRQTMPERLRSEPFLGTAYFLFNLNHPPLDNPLVREALAWSIDRQAIVEKVLQGGQSPALSFVPEGFSDYASPVRVGFDPAKARAALAEAGFPGGEGVPRISALITNGEGARKVAEALAEMWREHLGIEVQLENKEWKVYLDNMLQSDFDLCLTGWIGDYMDPITFLELYRTGNPNNNTGWSNDRYDQLIEQAFKSPTEEQHLSDLEEAEGILMRELPINPVFFQIRNYLMDPRVQGWHPKLLNNHPYKYLYLDPEGE